jgi:hypothetical protein
LATAVGIALGVLPLQIARGQFSDDFNDGNDNGWTRYNVLAQVGFPATFSFPDGGYRMETPQNWTNAQLGPGRVGSLVTGSNYSDFRITLDVTDWAAMSPSAFGALARITNAGLGTTDGYLLILNAEDENLDLSYIHEEGLDSFGTVDVSMVPDTDFRIVFSGFGTQLNAMVYDKAVLNSPLGFLVVDASITPPPWTSGAVGMVVGETDDPDGEADAATFDNFKVTAPIASEWNALGGGTLGIAPHNWVGNVPPVGVDAHARFLQSAEVDAEIIVDVNQLGKITFDNSHKYTLRGFGLQLETTTGSAEINVLSGSHELANDLTLASDTVVAVNPAAGNVSLSGLFNGGGKLLTKTGAGSLTVKNLGNVSLTVNGGTVVVEPNGGDAGTSALEALSISGPGRLNVNNNDVVVRATAATKNTVHGNIEDDIVSAQNGPDESFITKWDGPGLTSATARTANVAAGFDLTGLGVIRNSDLDIASGVPGSTFTTFGGQPVTPDDVLVKYTYTGDGNFDGAVTFDDYAAMDSAFFGLIQNLGWATGDVNFDNQITFDDYSVVDQAFFFQGAPLSGQSAVTAVPEPGTLAACATALVVLVGWRGRRRTRQVG